MACGPAASTPTAGRDDPSPGRGGGALPAALPARLEGLLSTLAGWPDRTARIEHLVEIARRFREVPPTIAERPFGDEHRVAHCPSGVFVWVVGRGDERLDVHFAVENPQGVAAKVVAVVLSETLAGESPAAVSAVPDDLAERVFGGELSPARSLGLRSLVVHVKAAALRGLDDAQGTDQRK